MPATVTHIPVTSLRRELAYRRSGAAEIQLLWSRDTDTLALVVRDERGSFELVLAADEALDAFEHPYAYATQRGLDLPALAA